MSMLGKSIETKKKIEEWLTGTRGRGEVGRGC